MLRPPRARLDLTLKLRLLGGGVGALPGPLLLVAFMFDPFTTIIATIGIGVGTLMGFLYGPRVGATERPLRLAVGLAGLAAGMGIVVAALGFALADSCGAAVTDVFLLALLYVALVAPVGAIIGGPMALAGALAATWLLRRLARSVDRLWPVGAVGVGAVAAVTCWLLVQTVATAGDAAAQQGDRVPFEHEVINHSGRHYQLEIRDYWQGEVAGGSSSDYVGRGCSWGTGEAQSEWAVWLAEPNLDWHDRPNGAPITSADHIGGPVRLRIEIAPDGQVITEFDADDRHPECR